MVDFGVIAMLILVIGLAGFSVSGIFLAVWVIRKKKCKKFVITMICFAVLSVLGAFFVARAGAAMLPDAADFGSESGLTAEVTSGKSLSFQTTDYYGNPVESSVFSENKVTLVNRFEPWCGPCRGEMPDLQALSEKYGEQGFGILGVYSDEEGLQEVLLDTGVTYPVIRLTPDLEFFERAVPASVFVDSEGNLLGIPESEQTPLAGSVQRFVVLGARSYDEWENLIQGFLK